MKKILAKICNPLYSGVVAANDSCALELYTTYT